jgi:DNA-binding transcriptional LysR family regulator
MLDPDYELFAHIVQEGSISAGARFMRLSQAMASKRLARLEARLGSQLIRRSTRRMALTATGAVFYADIAAILSAVRTAESRVLAGIDQPTGLLRIAAPTSFGRVYVAPILADFLTTYPKVTAELELSDEYTDLFKSGFDIAIRITNVLDRGLVAERLADSKRVLCAAPPYLERYGVPQLLSDLAQHRILAARGQMPWRLSRGTRDASFSAESRVVTNSSEVVRELAVRGVGIALRSLWDVSAELADGRLVRVLPDYEGSANVGIFAVHPPSSHVPAATSAFIAALADRFRPVPPWQI